MTVPLLSICIATYNRADMIGQTLDSIISQIREEVEIVVVDGASTDDTANVMRQYQDRCPSIRYHRMPVKGGVDRDYCHAVSFATGDYCWLLTDDDVVKPGAIVTILSLLPRKYSLIILNAEVWDRALTNRVKYKQLSLESDTFYEPSSRERLFRETLSYLSFIGAVVIDRVLWNERIKEPYIGTEFIHVGVIFQKELPHGAFAVAEPCIMIRSGNAQWSPRHFSIWMIKWPDLIWSFPGISDAAKARVSPRNPWDDPLTLLLERAFGVYSRFEYHNYIKARSASRWRILIAGAVALIPGVIVNFIVTAYYTLTAAHDVFLWHNLKSSRFYYRKYLSRIALSLKKTIMPSGAQKNS
jgi:glycosyltransferase involved in cell wall biosynthesis